MVLLQNGTFPTDQRCKTQPTKMHATKKMKKKRDLGRKSPNHTPPRRIIHSPSPPSTPKRGLKQEEKKIYLGQPKQSDMTEPEVIVISSPDEDRTQSVGCFEEYFLPNYETPEPSQYTAMKMR